jgi:hypothetical protein
MTQRHQAHLHSMRNVGECQGRLGLSDEFTLDTRAGTACLLRKQCLVRLLARSARRQQCAALVSQQGMTTPHLLIVIMLPTQP